MAENSIRIVSYNVENLFHTPDSTRNWTRVKYWNKINKISRVLTNMCSDDVSDTEDNVLPWRIPAIVGLQEIENDSCLIHLCRKLRNLNYKYVHYDSPDHRGIDVGLLYDSTQYRVLHSEPLRVNLDSQSTTRDILFVEGVVLATNDTLYLMVCHLPSMLGGHNNSQWKRDSALKVIDCKKQELAHKKLVIMGDFNDDNTIVKGMHKAFSQPTHKYNGRWTQLDYFWLSDSLIEKANAHVYDAHWLLEEDPKYLGTRPRRTYNGWHYNPEGYSDHLPIYLDLTFD